MVFRTEEEFRESQNVYNGWDKGWGGGVYGLNKEGVQVNGAKGAACAVWPISRKHAIVAAHAINPSPMEVVVDADGNAANVLSVRDLANDVALVTIVQEFKKFTPLWWRDYGGAVSTLVIAGGRCGVGDGTEAGTDWRIPNPRVVVRAGWGSVRQRSFPRKKLRDRHVPPAPDLIGKMGETQGPDLMLKAPPWFQIGDSSGGVFVKTPNGGWRFAGVMLAGGDPACAPIASEAIREFYPELIADIDAAGGLDHNLSRVVENQSDVQFHSIKGAAAEQKAGAVCSGVKRGIDVYAGDTVEFLLVPPNATSGWTPTDTASENVSITFAAMGLSTASAEVLGGEIAGARRVVRFNNEGTYWVFGTAKVNGLLSNLTPAVVNVKPRQPGLVFDAYERKPQAATPPPPVVADPPAAPTSTSSPAPTKPLPTPDRIAEANDEVIDPPVPVKMIKPCVTSEQTVERLAVTYEVIARFLLANAGRIGRQVDELIESRRKESQ